MGYRLTLFDAFEPTGRPHILTRFRQFPLSESQALKRSSGVRRWAARGFAEVMAAVTCRRIIDSITIDPARVGVLSNAGSGHVPIAWELTERLQTDGLELLNPLRFPHTIPSSVAATVSEHCRAQAFALAVGHDHFAFGEAVQTAVSFLEADMADAVLIVAAGDSGPPLDRALRASGSAGASADVCICGLLSPIERFSEEVPIQQVICESALDAGHASVSRVPEDHTNARLKYELRDGQTFALDERRVLGPDLFSVSGAVVVLDAIQYARTKGIAMSNVEIKFGEVRQMFRFVPGA